MALKFTPVFFFFFLQGPKAGGGNRRVPVPVLIRLTDVRDANARRYGLYPNALLARTERPGEHGAHASARAERGEGEHGCPLPRHAPHDVFEGHCLDGGAAARREGGGWRSVSCAASRQPVELREAAM
jgi:hypothetical protein